MWPLTKEYTQGIQNAKSDGWESNGWEKRQEKEAIKHS